jgi:hypothetical protein
MYLGFNYRATSDLCCLGADTGTRYDIFRKFMVRVLNIKYYKNYFGVYHHVLEIFFFVQRLNYFHQN